MNPVTNLIHIFVDFFSGKLLHDKSLAGGVRAHLLRLLAASALKDDIILLLHQDRKEHLLMNYAHDFDRLPVAEQDALTFFVCITSYLH